MDFELEYLILDDILEIHQMALEEYGGLPGRERNKLEAFIPMPYAGFGDYDKYQTIQEKAAVYLYYLASGHYFKDGNKRTAYVSAFTFLDWNGYDLIATDDEVYDFTVLIANDKTRPPFEDAIDWMYTHIHIQEEQQDEDQEEYPVVENP